MVLRYPCSPAARRRASSRAAFTAGSACVGVTGGAGGVGGAGGIGGGAGIEGMVKKHMVVSLLFIDERSLALGLGMTQVLEPGARLALRMGARSRMK